MNANSILLAGTDPRLLQQRSQLLSLRYETELASPEETLDRLSIRKFSILILCQSIPTSICLSLIMKVRARFPLIAILRLTEEGPSTLPIYLQADTTIYATQQPSSWLPAVDQFFSGSSKG